MEHEWIDASTKLGYDERDALARKGANQALALLESRVTVGS
jgi:hypothetical protein